MRTIDNRFREVDIFRKARPARLGSTVVVFARRGSHVGGCWSAVHAVVGQL